MAVTDTLLNLLRRPTRAPEPAPTVKPRKGDAPPPPRPAPVTEAELLAALDAAAAERRAAETRITEAAARREALLLEPDSDDAILAAGQDIDRAQLVLERLDKIVPDLHARLRDVRRADRIAAWPVARDRYIAACAPFVAALAEFDAVHRPALDAARAALFAEFPDAGGVLPVPPLPPAGAADAFASALRHFAQIVHDPARPPLPVVMTLAEAEERARLMGEELPEMFGKGPVSTVAAPQPEAPADPSAPLPPEHPRTWVRHILART